MKEGSSLPAMEPRWHASLAILAAMALYITLPPRLTIGPGWVAPAIILMILIPLSILVPRRGQETHRMRFWSILLIAIVNFFNLVSVILLVAHFFHPEKAAQYTATDISRIGAQIWLTNVLVFALWYWELDGDGPDARAQAPAAREIVNADFLFPQTELTSRAHSDMRCIDPRWKPQFFDYLYVAFTNATAFSPADVMPLSRWAKALMMLEALVSLVTIAVVVSRAISLL